MKKGNKSGDEIFNPFESSSKENFVEIIGKHGKELERQGKMLDWTFGFILAILVICVIAFVTFIVDAWRFHQEAYHEYNKTIEELKSQNQNLELQRLNDKIDLLQNNISKK